MKIGAFAAPLAVFAMSLPSVASDGIEERVVRFAQVAALDGQAGTLGSGMRKGILAAFAEANRAGGIHGRMVELDSFDDGYQPDRSIVSLRSLVDGGAHFGFIGPVGTTTSQSMQPVATEAGLPFIGPVTGAEFLRDPALTNVVNVRASYAVETEALIAHLVDDLGMDAVAILYQDDGFGRSGLAGVTAALERRGKMLVAEGTYTPDTTDMTTALLDIRLTEPDVVVTVGADRPITEFIRLSRKLRFEPIFASVSSVDSDALAKELGADGTGVIISQVVPFPWDVTNPVVADYQAAMAAHDPNASPGFVTLEGYLVGRVALRALETAGRGVSRASFVDAVARLGEFDLGGLTFSYGPGDNQGLDSVFLTRITSDGGFEAVSGRREHASR